MECNQYVPNLLSHPSLHVMKLKNVSSEQECEVPFNIWFPFINAEKAIKYASSSDYDNQLQFEGCALDQVNSYYTSENESRLTYGQTDAMVDATKRDSSKRISEEEKVNAVLGPLFKIRKEREIRAKVKEEAKRIQEENALNI